ncbi:MAG: hypothetical protein AAF483_28140 [Planctomycetota bacterium]
MHEPVADPKSVTRLAFGQFSEGSGDSGIDLFTLVEEIATIMNFGNAALLF